MGSVYEDMAYDAGYRGQELFQVAQQLEHSYEQEYYRMQAEEAAMEEYLAAMWARETAVHQALLDPFNG